MDLILSTRGKKRKCRNRRVARKSKYVKWEVIMSTAQDKRPEALECERDIRQAKTDRKQMCTINTRAQSVGARKGREGGRLESPVGGIKVEL